MDKFTYYDTVADLIPGILSVWAISVLGPFEEINYSMFLTENQIIDAVLFISICFTIGHIIKFLSKYFIEPLLKLLFWKGKFFSEIYLINSLEYCPEIELKNILSFTKNKFKFSTEDLNILFDEKAFSDKEKQKKATQLSQIIFRKLDAQSKNSSIAIKAHTQNVFYGLFRNLSTLFLIIFIMNLIMVCFRFIQQTILLKMNLLISGIIMVIFLIRAKQRGESYVKGIFWSISEK